MWPTDLALYGFALEFKSNDPVRVPAKLSSISLSPSVCPLTGSSCNSTETAWGGPWRFFAPPCPNAPSQPTPVCPDRPLRRSQPGPGCLQERAGLEGRRGPARAPCRNADVLPTVCREGNNPAPATRAAVPSPSTRDAARLSLRLEGRQRAMGGTMQYPFEFGRKYPAVDRSRLIFLTPDYQPRCELPVPSSLASLVSGCGRGRWTFLLSLNRRSRTQWSGVVQAEQVLITLFSV